eukprot:3979507-Pleurochrysis_carterae.AAC.1
MPTRKLYARIGQKTGDGSAALGHSTEHVTARRPYQAFSYLLIYVGPQGLSWAYILGSRGGLHYLTYFITLHILLPNSYSDVLIAFGKQDFPIAIRKR